MQTVKDYLICYANRCIERILNQRVPCTVGVGFTYEPIGKEEITYDVLLHQTKLEILARKAANNKSEKAVAGPVQIRITARKRVA